MIRVAFDTPVLVAAARSRSHAWLQEIFFLWRPFLPDAGDDMILELAFAANCRYIVTHNTRDFRGCERLGIAAITPREFLKMMRGSKP
jgi:hypothetical protein